MEGQQQRNLQGHKDSVQSVAFSPDGNLIVSGSADKSLRVWEVQTGNQLRIMQGHTDTVQSVAFSPDGNLIVSGSRDRSIQLWDSETGHQLRKLQGHANTVYSVAFSSDSELIVSGSEDCSVRVWDAKGDKLLRGLQVFNNQIDLAGVSADINQICSSDDQLKHALAHSDFDNLWVMREDGWIFCASNRLIWIPPSICNVLHHPHGLLTISQSGFAEISFKNSKLGSSWPECYTPKIVAAYV